MKKFFSIFFLLIPVLLCACGRTEEEAIEPDPHEGQVYVYDGYGFVWMTPIEGLERSPFAEADFRVDDDTPVYIGSEFTVEKGIDVSEHQLLIDWSKLQSEELDFAFVRCGYRGYTEGGIYEDDYFNANMQGAKNLGLKTGVYFCTQAINVAEAIEEANFVIELLQGWSIDLPVAYDWERMYTDEARAENLSVQTRTDCAVAFLETVKAAGYTPCIYYNRTIGYYEFDLSRFSDYVQWFSLPITPPDVIYPSFLYSIDIWQYSISESLPGISTEVDMDYIFTPVM